jgi:hypothetical protein
MTPKKLTDNEAHTKLWEAEQALGRDECETLHANTALEAARVSMRLLQMALLTSSERQQLPLHPKPPE